MTRVERGEVAGQERGRLASSVVEVVGVEHDAVLDDLGQPGAVVPLGQASRSDRGVAR